jgi:5'-phosphate synthase pdxT subunit
MFVPSNQRNSWPSEAGRYVPKRIGVLALQGDFAEHASMLRRLDVDVCLVRLPQHLDGLDGLIFPGGESTTIAHLIDKFQLRDPLVHRIQNGMPTWGTCAGMIVLAQSMSDDRPTPLGLMGIHVTRNAFGRQVDSFEEYLDIPALGGKTFRAVFIRAPVVLKVHDGAEVMARLGDGRVVAVKQKNMIATAFHPELTNDTRFHNYFVQFTISCQEEAECKT